MKWEMICHIAIATRANRKRYGEMFDRIALPKVKLATAQELTRFYNSAGLRR